MNGMYAEFLRRCFNTASYELREINLFPSQLEVGIVDSGRAEQACREFVELVCMLIDQGNELLFSAGQGIHFKQTGT